MGFRNQLTTGGPHIVGRFLKFHLQPLQPWCLNSWDADILKYLGNDLELSKVQGKALPSPDEVASYTRFYSNPQKDIQKMGSILPEWWYQVSAPKIHIMYSFGVLQTAKHIMFPECAGSLMMFSPYRGLKLAQLIPWETTKLSGVSLFAVFAVFLGPNNKQKTFLGGPLKS